MHKLVIVMLLSASGCGTVRHTEYIKPCVHACTLIDAASVPSLEHPEQFGENNLLDFMFTDRAK